MMSELWLIFIATPATGEERGKDAAKGETHGLGWDEGPMTRATGDEEAK